MSKNTKPTIHCGKSRSFEIDVQNVQEHNSLIYVRLPSALNQTLILHTSLFVFRPGIEEQARVLDFQNRVLVYPEVLKNLAPLYLS